MIIIGNLLYSIGFQTHTYKKTVKNCGRKLQY